MFYRGTFKKIRKEKKIKLQILAAKLGRTRKVVWAWEAGRSIPPESDIRIAAQLLGVPLSEISDLKEIDLGNAKPKERENDIPHINLEDVNSDLVKEFQQTCLNFRSINTRLRASLNNHEVLLQSLPFVIYSKNKELKYVRVNESFLNILKRSYTKESITGMTSYEVFKWEDYAPILTLEQEVLRSKQRISSRQIYIPGTLKQKIGLLTIIPILDERQQLTEIVCSIEDITDSYKEEKRRKDLEAAVNKINHMVWIGETIPGKKDSFFYTFISNNILDVYGVTKEEGFKDNKIWEKLIHEDSIEEVNEWKEVITLPKSINYKINHPEKGVRWVSSEIFKEGSNKYYGIVKDITAEKEEGSEKEAILRTLDAATDAIKIAKIQNNKKEYIYVNKANKNLYETPLSKIRKNPELWKNFVHPDDKEKLISIDQKKHEGRVTLDYRLLLPNGETKHIEENIFRTIIDGMFYSGTIKRDITEKHKKDETIKLLANTMNNIDSCILITTNTKSTKNKANFKMLFVSDGFEKIFATPKQAILDDARYLQYFIHPNDFEQVNKCWEEVCDIGLKQEISLKYRIISADGKEKLVTDYAKPLGIINGNPIRFGMITDITNSEEK